MHKVLIIHIWKSQLLCLYIKILTNEDSVLFTMLNINLLIICPLDKSC